jgi:hypothetical protein
VGEDAAGVPVGSDGPLGGQGNEGGGGCQLVGRGPFSLGVGLGLERGQDDVWGLGTMARACALAGQVDFSVSRGPCFMTVSVPPHSPFDKGLVDPSAGNVRVLRAAFTRQANRAPWGLGLWLLTTGCSPVEPWPLVRVRPFV